MPEVLDVLAWNPHVGNPAAKVLAVLDAEVDRKRPDVIVLNEVRNHRTRIASWCKRNGYVHFQEFPLPDADPKPEHGSTALLVSDDIEILSHRVVAMKIGWRVFSHNQPHKPRRYERVRLETPGGKWKVTASHWPTNGFTGGNRVPFAESAAAAATALVAKVPGTVGVDVGDHNESVSTLRKWAKTFLGRVDGHGPDSAIVVGGEVTARVFAKHGSDHHLIRYRITRTR